MKLSFLMPRLNFVISNLNPLSVIDQCYVIKKIGEAVPLECMDWDQALGSDGRRKSLEITGARVTGGVNDLKRDASPDAFLFEHLAGTVLQVSVPLRPENASANKCAGTFHILQHPATEQHHRM